MDNKKYHEAMTIIGEASEKLRALGLVTWIVPKIDIRDFGAPNALIVGETEAEAAAGYIALTNGAHAPNLADAKEREQFRGEVAGIIADHAIFSAQFKALDAD